MRAPAGAGFGESARRSGREIPGARPLTPRSGAGPLDLSYNAPGEKFEVPQPADRWTRSRRMETILMRILGSGHTPPAGRIAGRAGSIVADRLLVARG